jgi:stage V sporulation protein D (sporulation-specific penicillin-binding protein)
MRPSSINGANRSHLASRIHLWYGVLFLISCIFVIRLFYLQIIRYGHYRNAALASQLKQYQVPPIRGTILAHDGNQTVPVVLNEKLYTLFADPLYIKDARNSALALSRIIGGNNNDYETKMKADSRYAVLAKKLSRAQKDKIEQAISQETKDLSGKKGSIYLWKGIGLREESYRTYPQGDLGAQLLGFVNDEGQGKYGIEQALNSSLKGTPGMLKAITDAQGVPLVANKDNVIVDPKAGADLTLTIDVAMQRQLEDILKAGLDHAKSKSGSAIIIDPNNGAIKAMANYPTYNPAEFYKVEDGNTFNNAAVSSPLEVGSSMKPLTAAAALNQGVVNRNTSYYDPSFFVVDGYKITNIEEDGGAGTRTVSDILQLSLNTGATWLLMQMGGGEINQKARSAWHDYMVNHYGFGSVTGIEQGYEAPGNIPDPTKGYGLNLQYANTSFGQGMTATPIQMAAALAAVVNGGTYYRPRLIDKITNNNHAITQQPEKVKTNIVKPDVGKTIEDLMAYTFTKNHVLYGMPQLRSQYLIGGKTGTAQIAKPTGGYYDNKFNGTFMGFVGGDKPEYVIFVRVNEPNIAGYAGAGAAAPIFSNLTNMLIDNFGVPPRSN